MLQQGVGFWETDEWEDMGSLWNGEFKTQIRIYELLIDIITKRNSFILE